MADYTVIVDDHHGQVAYRGSWKFHHNNDTYKGTLHNAMSSNASMTYSFAGGREFIIRGNFVGDNNALESATYPVFQIDSQDVLKCSPNPPENGGQFLCSTPLDPNITNRTLTMFMNQNLAFQKFHIDYMRHGSSPKVAASDNATVVYVKAPNNTTPGLAFDSNWKYKSNGGTTDIKAAMRTSTTSASVTYNFVGDSLAWWACCLPGDISSNAANVTYSIDGGGTLSAQVDENFIQGPQCKDERILFQIHGDHGDQIQPGNHTLKVFYGGDDTKMPLTLCGLAASPLSLRNLDHDFRSDIPGKSPESGSSTAATPSSSTSLTPGVGSPAALQVPSSNSTTGIIAGVITGIVFLILSVFVIIYVLRRKRSRDVESRFSFDAPRLAIRRVVPSVDLAAHDPPSRRASIDKESILETPPPFYRSSMAKARFSWRSLSFRAHPIQQTAYVGSDYGASILSFNHRNSAQTFHTRSEPPRYNYGSKGYDPDPVLPLP